MSAGTIFCEMDLDFSRFEKSQQKLLQSAVKASDSVEANWKNLGVKSDNIFAASRASIENSYNMIKNYAGSTASEIVRAEEAKNAKLKALNEQQYGAQTSLLDSLKKNWIAVSAAAIAVIYGTERMFSFGKSIASAANDIERQSRILGLSTTEYQKLTYAAKMSDLQVEEFTTGIGIFSTKLEEARRGTGDAGRYLKAMGIDIDSTGWKSKSLSEKIGEVAEGFKSWEEGERKIAIARELFGRSGAAWIEFLNQGKKGIAGYGEELTKMGGVLGDVVIKKGSEAEEIFKKLDTQHNAMKISLAPLVLEFVKLAEAIGGATAKAIEFMGKGPSTETYRKQLVFETTGMPFEMYYEKPKAGGEWPSEARFALPVSKKPAPPELPDEKLLEKILDEEAKAWGIYADEQIAALEKLNLFKNEATKTEFERQKWAQEKIIEGETEFNQTRIDAWAAVYSVQAEEDQEWIKMHEYADQKIKEGEDEFRKESQEAWGAYNEYLIEVEKNRINIGEVFAERMGSAWNFNIKNIISESQSMADAVKKVFSGMGDAFTSAVSRMISDWILFGSITGKYEAGKGLLGWLGEGLSTFFGAKTGGVGGYASYYGEGGIIPEWKPIYGFQEGGLINRPTFGMIGEGGPEAVIPLKGGKIPVEGAKGTIINHYYSLNVNAVDAPSFIELCKRNPRGFFEALAKDSRGCGPMRIVIKGN